MITSSHSHSSVQPYATSRFRHAASLWREYLKDGHLPALDNWLAQTLKKHRQFGKQDRYWYSEILFAVVRFGYLAWFLEDVRKRHPAPGKAAPFERAIEAFAAQQLSPTDVCDAWRQLPPEQLFALVGKRYACEETPFKWPVKSPLDESLRQRYDALFDTFEHYQAQSSDVRAHLLWQGIPISFAEPLRARQTASQWTTNDLQTFLRRQALRPPLWIRLNAPERKHDVLREFEEYEAQVTEYQGTFNVQCSRSLFEFDTYQRGLFEIQDFASQQIGVDVAVQPGEFVWDCCAGEGGKTVQIGAQMRNRGAIYASDIREYKLKELRRRVSRAQIDNVRILPWDGVTLPAFPLEIAKRTGFDWVLVDASCTSTGTWRRNPDAKFRVTPDYLAELTTLQATLIRNAARMVRRGGHLVYSTCSWLVAEDEAIIEQFRAAAPDFQLVRQHLHGNPVDDADTMFSAVLRRDN